MPACVWDTDSDQGGGSGIGPAAFAIATGSDAVDVWPTGGTPSDGAIIVNPFGASESLFVDIVNAAQTTAPGTNGTTVELLAGGTFTVPPGFSGTVSANAVTTGHTFTAYGVG